MAIKKIHCFIDSLCSGGAQRQLVNLACMLKGCGYEVSVVVYHDDMFYKSHLDKQEVPYTLITDAKNPIKRIWKLYKYWETNPTDVVIAYLSTPTIIACMLRPFFRWKRLIVSERNTTQWISFIDKIRFWVWRYADVIVPNSYAQTDFIKHNVPKYTDRLVTITNGVNIEKFIPPQQRHKSPTVRILTVARITPQKNILNYIQAISKLKNNGYSIEVDWYGNTDNPEYYVKCKQLIVACNLSEVFRFHHAKTDIVEEYQRASVFCLPSLWEGFPNVICEAMSCGLPILCSAICDNEKLVTDGVNGFLFDPHSIDGIVQSIARFIDLADDDKCAMGITNRTKIVSMCDLQIMLNQYLNLIEK